MKNILIGFVSMLLAITTFVGLGYYRLNFTQDDIYVQMSDDSVVSADEYDEMLDGIHFSWDNNSDGINDCEDEDTCDHSIDYSEPRFM